MNKELQDCYEKGYDSIINGADKYNSHYALFSSIEKMNAWVRGRKDAIAEVKNGKKRSSTD